MAWRGPSPRCCATTATCPSAGSAPVCAPTPGRCCARPSCTSQATYRVPFTGVSALLYRTGEDFQGLHSDRELRWLDDTRIAIVVLGQRRPFVFRRRVPLAEVVERIPAGADPDDLVLMPGEGDMLVMGGASQRDWLHGVPKADTATRGSR